MHACGGTTADDSLLGLTKALRDTRVDFVPEGCPLLPGAVGGRHNLAAQSLADRDDVMQVLDVPEDVICGGGARAHVSP